MDAASTSGRASTPPPRTHALRRAVLLLVRQRHRLAPLERHAARRRRDRHAAAGLLRLEQFAARSRPIGGCSSRWGSISSMLNLHVDRNGANAYEQAAAESIFSVVDRLRDATFGWRFRFAPTIARASNLTEAIETIRRQFVPRPSYFHYEGEPVLFYFWTGVQDGNKPWINFVDDSTQGFLRIASSLRMYSAKDERRHTFGLFHGWSLYSPLELSAPANWERVWTQAYRNSDAGTRNLKIISVSPGYDDRHLRDPNRKTNPHRSVDRQQGDAYRRMLDFALVGRRAARHGVDFDVQRVSREHAHRAVAQSRLAVSEHDARSSCRKESGDGANDGHEAGGRHARCPTCWSIEQRLDLTARDAGELKLSFAPVGLGHRAVSGDRSVLGRPSRCTRRDTWAGGNGRWRSRATLTVEVVRGARRLRRHVRRRRRRRNSGRTPTSRASTSR